MSEAAATTPARALIGFPDGLLDLLDRLWAGIEGQLDRHAAADPSPPDRDRATWFTDLLLAPTTLEADWPAPAEPIPVTGGWVNAEVIDADRPILDSLLPAWVDLGPDRVAAAAQELRLPVCPYRPLDDRPAAPAPAPPTSAPAGHPPATGRPAPLEGRLVVDLTTHWAGPLATRLLADAGARVVKVDPSCRPDGFRDRPALYRHLNGGKDVVDLDLRAPEDRAQFESLLADADALVESFSRRVLGNLGYGPDRLATIAPDLRVLSIKAFPDDHPWRDWLAYGPGVHAASGLGLVDGEPTPAPLAYPDVVTGFAAAGRLLSLLAGPGGRAEVSLAGSIEPLVDRARRRRTTAEATAGAER